MKVIGIDPGQSGGIAVIHSTLTDITFSVNIFPMPDLAGFVRVMKGLGKDAHIFIEKAQSFPKQGISSAFNYGQHFGELLGVLAALQIRHTLVRPAIWTRVMHVGTKSDDTKKRSLEAVQRLFPEVNLVVGVRAKKPHDGIVDALLIAEWGRRQILGGQLKDDVA